MATGTSWRAAVLATATLVAGGCGHGSDDEPARDAGGTLVLELSEQNGSGQRGTATFTTLGNGRTRIALELTNPPDVPQPAHVHEGTCDDLGRAVITLPNVEGGHSVTETDTSLADLAGRELVIHAHKSEAEYDVSVACASLRDDG